MTRAKFRVASITRQKGTRSVKRADGSYVGEPCETQNITMYAVTDKTPANEAFFTATPSGKIELTCVNPVTIAQFDLDSEVYVDFSPAPPPSTDVPPPPG